jgi:hypothetical protein
MFAKQKLQAQQHGVILVYVLQVFLFSHRGDIKIHVIVQKYHTNHFISVLGKKDAYFAISVFSTI